MSNYTKQNLKGKTLKAEYLEHIEDGIVQLNEEFKKVGPTYNKKGSSVNYWTTEGQELTIISHINYSLNEGIVGYNTLELTHNETKTYSKPLDITVYKGSYNWATGELKTNAILFDEALFVEKNLTITSTGTSSTGIKYVGISDPIFTRDCILACNLYSIVNTVPTTSGCVRATERNLFIYDNNIDLDNPQTILSGLQVLIFTEEATSTFEKEKILALEGLNTFTSNCGETEIKTFGSLLGTIDQLSKIHVTPEMFGAVGDGVTDDSDAIISALSQGKPVHFNGSYGVSKELSGNAPAVIGNNAIFNVLSNVGCLFSLPNASVISGLTFNCNNFGVEKCISATNKNVEISNIEIYDVKDLRTNAGSTLISVEQNENISIKNIYVHDCSHIINGVVGDKDGNITCIYAVDYTQNCNIENVSIKEIHNIDSNGNIAFEDGGGIYVRATEKTAGTTINNIYGYNYCKRLIKAQCMGTVVINGVTSYTNSKDHLAAIAIQTTENENQTELGRGIISNCYLVNEYVSDAPTSEQYLITSSEDILIDNCYFESLNQFAILGASKISISNCKCKGNFIMISNTLTECCVSDCNVSGSTILTALDVHANNNMKVKIYNSTFTRTFDGVVNRFSYGPFTLNVMNVLISQSTFDNVYIDTKGILQMNNCRFVNAPADAIIIKQNGNANLKDIQMFGGGDTPVGRAINVEADGIIKVDGVIVENYNLSVVGSGAVTLKNTLLNKVYAKDFVSLTVYPEYYATLPTNVNSLKDGIRILLETNNKMYVLQNKEWVIVE